MIYPQNGDSFVTIDSVTSFHPMYTSLPPTPCYFFYPSWFICLVPDIGVTFLYGFGILSARLHLLSAGGTG